MQMGELRCKTPELVRKEVWAHVLAYNLIRTVMAQAAARHGVAPRSISFTGAMQTLEAFQPLLEFGAARDAAGRLAPVPRPARCHRHPPGRRPPRPVRAAAEEAEAQPLRLADQAPRRDETQDGQRRYQEVSAIRRGDRSRKRSHANSRSPPHVQNSSMPSITAVAICCLSISPRTPCRPVRAAARGRRRRRQPACGSSLPAASCPRRR